jgi:glycosyltransferase involved in cell wall biosynthesis
MKLVHFALDGAVVGGVERYLADLLGSHAAGLEHAVVLEARGRCEFAGPWPVTTASWSAEASRHATDEAVLDELLASSDAVCLFHYPPSEATLATARKAGAPAALFCHDHRWWCASASRYHALTRRVCAIHASTPACALRYHALRCGGLAPGRLVRGLGRAAAGRRALARADAVLAASAFMAAEARLHGALPGRTHVVPLPTAAADPELPAPRAPGAPPVVLFASRLTPEKGVATLLEAFALMRRPARLELAGTGIAAPWAAEVARAHPRAADITLLGHLERHAMAGALARAAVVAVPSLWPEPFGLVGIEALAAGRPVVATGVGGTADWARPELGVLVVPPGRPAALAEALDRAVTDPSWTERARTAGAVWVRERHSVAAHVARLTEVLAARAEVG